MQSDIRPRALSSLALTLALLLGCGCAQARCIGFVANPSETDLAKAEIKHAVVTSAAVFIGQVTAMEYMPAHTERGDGEMLVIKMGARSWWKGTGGEEVRLDTAIFRDSDGAISSEAHEYSFQIGRTYLVYANAVGLGLRANLCTRTKALEEAAEDIALLNALTSE